jgi:hypothetical protein
MSEYKPSPPDPELEKPSTTLLYRGVLGSEEHTRIGQWWTTNPYYALVYAEGGVGKMFVVSIDTDKLGSMAYDVSQDEGYQNYGFVEQDPPGARMVTQDEINALLAISLSEDTAAPNTDLPGGKLLKTPEDPIAAGKAVFGSTFEEEK